MSLRVFAAMSGMSPGSCRWLLLPELGQFSMRFGWLWRLPLIVSCGSAEACPPPGVGGYLLRCGDYSGAGRLVAVAASGMCAVTVSGAWRPRVITGGLGPA
jgi:hypothetical protein